MARGTNGFGARGRAIAAAWLTCVLGQPAAAADMQVAPVSLQFAPADKAQLLWIDNLGTGPVQVQVRVQQWSQTDGAERLEPTRELVASPPLTSIAPGARQLVRIVRPTALASDRERSYRVIVDELPGPGGDSNGSGSEQRGSGLRLLLRYSIPVFIAPEGTPTKLATPADVSGLRVRWVAGDPARLQIENAGRRRVKVSALVQERADGKRTVLVPGLLGYALAGSTMRWELPPAAIPGVGSLKVRLNDDPIEQTLPLDPRGS